MADRTKENIAMSIKSQRSMGLKGDSWDNFAVARETLHAELGYNGETAGRISYDLDATTRDVLIVHARQDAAHALANTTSLIKRVRTLTLLAYFILIGMLLVLLRSFR